VVSIRWPAAVNNIVGLAPTQELVSRDGMMGAGLNTRVGPVCRTVQDAAKVLATAYAATRRGGGGVMRPHRLAYGLGVALLTTCLVTTSARAQLAVQQSLVDQARALLQLTQQQRDELKVRAGLDGMLQLVPVEVGQQVAPGTNLARVANPSRLKAEIKIAETQAKDIQLGQKAEVDTRNGIVEGRVARIDPSVINGTRTVDVTLMGDLPKGAVPDLSVDGTIELERLNDVLFMGRPAFGQDQSTVGLFKIGGDGIEAERTQVKLGRSSVNTIEVLSGLKVGDQVILSDMSAYDAYDRIRLK